MVRAKRRPKFKKPAKKKNENQQGKFKEETKNALINLAYLSGMSVPILGSFDGSPVLMRTAWAWDLQRRLSAYDEQSHAMLALSKAQY
jgi:hypothetical protein